MPFKKGLKKSYKKMSGTKRSFTSKELMSRMRSAYMAKFVQRAMAVPAVSHLFVLKLAPDVVSSSSAGLISQSYGTNKLYGTTDFIALSTLYDSWKCNAMCIEYFPATQASGLLSYAPLPVYYDPDSNSPAMSVAGGLEYESCKVWDLTKNQKYTYKIPRFDQVSATNLTDGYSVFGMDGFFDIAALSSTTSGYNFGVVAWYGTGFSISSTYGTVVVSFLLEYKFRR